MPTRENHIRNLSYLSRCTFDLRYINRSNHEIVCVNCLLDEPIIERKDFNRKTTHSVVFFNILNLTRCDICNNITSKVRPARACTKCKEILFKYLNSRNNQELENIYNLAHENPCLYTNIKKKMRD